MTKEKNKGFGEQNDIEGEFGIFFLFLDEDMNHQNNLIQKFDNKDRYSDIKPYKYNYKA